MAVKDLKNKPHQIDHFWWWYEEGGGICILHDSSEYDGAEGAVKTRMISWRAIRAALRRKDKK